MKLDIQVDPNFTGTLQEAQQYPSAVRLDGVCHVELEKPMKTKGLLIQFTGILKVDVRKGLTLNPDASDATERRVLIDKTQHLAGDGSKTSIIPPGTHRYPFIFYIPVSLPPSFHSNKGQIVYNLRAAAKRSLLSDIVTDKTISLRKCLSTRLSSLLSTREHVEGVQDGLAFAVTTPSIVCREGGQLKLVLSLELVDAPNCQITSITCGLKESVIYRTSGSKSLHRETRQVSDISFPLGMQNIDCHKSHSTPRYYDVDLRLIPKIHTDMSTKLLKVRHHVYFVVSAERWNRQTNPYKMAWTKRYKIEVPVIVSSKEKYWDGRMPSPPPYSQYEMPPCYVDSLTQLPPIPGYNTRD